jgi:hypothetical protein
MTRYVLIAASAAVLASLSACAFYRDPAPRVGGPESHEDRQDRASYSSQLSVMNRRAEHAKKDESSSSSSR